MYSDKAYTSYKTEEIGKGVFRVEFNVYDTWTENNPFIAKAKKDIKFDFEIKDKSSKDYEIVSDKEETTSFEVVQNNKDSYDNNESNTNLLLKSNSNEPVAGNNAIVLYIDSKIDDKGKPVVKKINSLWISGFDANYDVEDVSDTRKKVTIELYKWWPKNQPAIINKGNTLQIGISYRFNSQPYFYKVSLANSTVKKEEDSVEINHSDSYEGACQIVENSKPSFSRSGSSNTSLKFKCNNKPLIGENSIVFYIVSKLRSDGKSAIEGINSIWGTGSNAEYKVEQISPSIKKVTVGLYKWWPEDEGFVVDDGMTLSMSLSYFTNKNDEVSAYDYYITASIESQENTSFKMYQFHRGVGGLIYAIIDSMDCAGGEKCDDVKLSIAEGCKEFGSCDAISQLNKLRLGVVAEKEE